MKRFLLRFIIAVTTVAAIFLLCACYTPSETDAFSEHTYTVTYTDGNTLLFTKTVGKRECAEFLTPPEREGYVFGYWSLWGEPFDFDTPVTRDITLNAEWSLRLYTLKFVADGELVSEVNFTIKDASVTPPDLPEKPGYDGKWEEFTLDKKDLTVNAVYSPITYYVRFYKYETLIAEVPFTVENTAITEPAVPEMEGYIGRWPEYELTCGDVNVVAIYEPVGSDNTGENPPVNSTADDDEDPPVTDPDDKDSEDDKGGGTGGNTEGGDDNGDNTEGDYGLDEKEPPVINEFYYDSIDGGCKITGLKSNETIVCIPSEYKGMKVLGIGDGFAGNTSIESLLIANGVKFIDDYAFRNCTALEKIVLPESLETIGEYAFSKTAVTELNIPSLKNCGGYAFSRCRSLVSVTLGDKVEIIGLAMFYDSSALESVYIGAGVKSISYYAFTGCSLNSAIFASPDDWTYDGGGLVDCDFSDAQAAARFLLGMSDDIYR